LVKKFNGIDAEKIRLVVTAFSEEFSVSIVSYNGCKFNLSEPAQIESARVDSIQRTRKRNTKYKWCLF